MVSLLLAGFVDETVAFLPYGALEPLRHDLGLNYASAAALLALYPGVGLVGGVFGVLADRHSRRLIAAGARSDTPPVCSCSPPAPTFRCWWPPSP